MPDPDVIQRRAPLMKPDRTIQASLRTALAFAALAVIGIAPAGAPAQEPDALALAVALEKSFVKTIADVEQSVVSIARFKTAPPPRGVEGFNPLELDPRKRDALRERFDPASPDFIPNDFGAGIIVAPKERPDERYILTNYHVVRGGPPSLDAAQATPERPDDFQLYVRFPNRRGYKARIYAADPRSDLAVLEIDFATLGMKPADLKPITFTTEAEFRKGQLVLSLGNPYAIGRDGAASASWGMISNISRRPAPIGSFLDEDARRRETIHHFGTLMHLDTRLNLGTSGGPVVNLKGELIGIATSLAALEGYEKSAGYAIPVDPPTRRMIADLMKGYEVEYGFLGIQLTDVDPETLRTQFPAVSATGAAMAQTVIMQSPAARAIPVSPEPPSPRGLQSRDLILAVNGQPVHNRHDLMRLVGLLEPDSKATLKVWREKARRELQVEVTLGKWPVLDDEGIIASRTRWPEWRGIAVDYCTARQRYLQEHQYPAAVLITKAPGKGAGPDDLQPGDLVSQVNDRDVRTPAEFHRVVEDLDGDVTLKTVDRRTIVIRK